MGLLERMKSLVKANVRDILQKAEDPEQALDQLIRTMDAELAEARAGIAGAIRDERKLHDNYEHHLREADLMLERAKAAAAGGQDDLAREALRRRRDGQQAATGLKTQWELQSKALAELREHLAYLETKVEQARRERTTLLARRRLARARKGLHEGAALGPLSSSGATFDRLTEAVDELDAEAQAYAELAREDAAVQIAGLEREAATADAQIEAELARIKKEIAGKPDAG